MTFLAEQDDRDHRGFEGCFRLADCLLVDQIFIQDKARTTHTSVIWLSITVERTAQFSTLFSVLSTFAYQPTENPTTKLPHVAIYYSEYWQIVNRSSQERNFVACTVTVI